MNTLYLIFFSTTALVYALATPKKYIAGDNREGGFQPSNIRYYESPLSDNNRNGSSKADQKETKESTAINRYQRFGNLPLPPSGYGNTGAGVHGYPPPGGVGYMMPMKIDIGGVALGALLGLGAVLIAPKLMSAFHMVGPGYRSLDNNNNSTITEILARIDNSLEQHNIDSSSCMQRVICTYVYESQKNLKNGEGGTVDEVVAALSNNSLFSFMLDGSAVKQAIDMGKQGDSEKCSSLYVKCPISRENIMQVITSLLPA